MKRSLIATLIVSGFLSASCAVFSQEVATFAEHGTLAPVTDGASVTSDEGTAPIPSTPSETAQPAASDKASVEDAAHQEPPQPSEGSALVSDNETGLPAEPGDDAMRIAFLMPAKDSPFESATLDALQGVLASNYASENPVRVLLVYPGNDDSVAGQLEAAAMAGAMAVVGPLDRDKVEEIGRLNYVPLPVVTLNQVDLDIAQALSPEEIEAEKERVKSLQLSLELEKQVENTAAAVQTDAMLAQPADVSASVENIGVGGHISTKTSVPGLVYGDEIPVSKWRYEPRTFPRNMLMLGLSMEDDAAYVARLGLAALPETTESGEKPKVLILDHDTPLEKRISESFERELVDAGMSADRMTVDVKDIGRVNQFFKLVVDKLDKEEFDEVPIDQEVDPVGWRQQQIRIRRLQAAKRARAALSEPPYYAAFLAMDAKTASLVRSRLPLRTRVWGTPLINPGDTKTNPQAKAMTYDLMHVALTESPMILNFDAAKFEEKYRAPAPQNTVQTRLFALGADALTLATSIARGTMSGVVDGNLGKLHYNLSVSPLVERRGQTAMINGGTVREISQEEVLAYQSINTKARPLSRMRAQSRSLERLEKEAQEAAKAAGTLEPVKDTPANAVHQEPLPVPEPAVVAPTTEPSAPTPALPAGSGAVMQ